ncbi:hypothetical protein CPB97_001655 [Podila verticillata]|nr:hypothetical protein CPB97_001655 [Podila verticillata]
MSNVEFPKINVSAKADIQYLGGVWRAVLHEQLKKQYGADGDPRLMQEVEIIMEEWLEKMFVLAAPNIDVNGIPFQEAFHNDEFEPLDESLNRKVQMQQLKMEEMTLKVAERRKRVPEQVKMLLDDAIRRQSAMADRVEFEADEDNQAEEDADIWEYSLQRPDLVTQEYTSAIELLNGLRKTTTSISRIEEAQVVIDETFKKS